jgi:hypothetical protein
MYCPQCRAERGDGFTECPECHGALLPGSEHAFDPALELVVVLESNDRVQIAMARGLLEDAGIPFFVQGQITTLIQDVDGFLRKWIRLQVPRGREGEARELLEQLLQPVPPDDADALGEGH